MELENKRLLYLIATFIFSFVLMIYGINQLIQIAYSPSRSQIKEIETNRNNIIKINSILNTDKKVTSIYLNKNFESLQYVPFFEKPKNISTLSVDEQNTINRTLLLKEKEKYLSEIQEILEKPESGFSIFNLCVWIWSIIVWTGAMMYKKIIEIFSEVLIRRAKLFRNLSK